MIYLFCCVVIGRWGGRGVCRFCDVKVLSSTFFLTHTLSLSNSHTLSHTHAHTRTHTHAHTHTHARTHTQFTHTCTYTHTNAHTREHLWHASKHTNFPQAARLAQTRTILCTFYHTPLLSHNRRVSPVRVARSIELTSPPHTIRKE